LESSGIVILALLKLSKFVILIMKQIDVREGAKRQHRTIALFCVIQCWIMNSDGLVLDRTILERLLGLERFKQTRVDWLVEDFEDFFPFNKTEEDFYTNSDGYTNYNQTTFSRLTVSRVSFDQQPIIKPLKIWNHPTYQQLRELYEGFIPFFVDYANYDERLIASYLSLLAQGQISPKSIPPLDVSSEGL
jgi:hypothetical protein